MTLPVGLLTPSSPPPLFRASVSSISTKSSITGGPYTVAYSKWVPPDVTSVKVRIRNISYNNGANAGASFSSDIAIGKSNGTITPAFNGTPVQYAGQTIPGNGTEYVSADTAVTRGSDGKVVVSLTIPPSTFFYFEDLAAPTTGWYYNSATATAFPLPALTSSSFSFLTVSFDYRSNAKKIVVLGDSLSEGKAITKTARWAELLETSGGYAVYNGGSVGSKLEDWADPAKTWLTDLQINSGATAIIALGTNDSIAVLPLAQMQAHFQTIVANVLAAGVTRVIAMTIAPGALNNCTRSTDFNTWLLAGVSGVTSVLNTVTLLRSIGDPCTLAPAYAAPDGEHHTDAADLLYYNSLVPLLP